MKILRLIFLFLVLLTSVQARLYWVFLVDDVSRPEAILSERAQNRISVKGQAGRLGDRDVSPVHLKYLREAGVKILTTSRFLNAVSAEVASREELEKINSLHFVQSARPVGSRPVRRDIEPAALNRPTFDETDYGDSYNQNDMLGIPLLHQYGYDGSGVLIAMFDTGFNQSHPAFNEMDVQQVYDFVDRDADVSTLFLSNHGDNCLSIVGGYDPGELVGPAYGASYILARTEDISSETRVEEHNWLAAVEWADSLGADIISSSLAYFDFDGTGEDYPFSALDGQTTVVTRAANIAASRGILVVNSMGNEGPGVSSLWAPADSPHILSVGAINPDETIASFSSRGPTADGRIKPDVVAQGTSVYLASGSSSYRTGQGTSFSAPLISGLAALLLQASPTLSPDTMISIFKQNGDQAGDPNNTFGYGIPNLVHLFDPIEGDRFLDNRTYPNPSSYDFIHLVLPHRIPGEIESGDLYDIKGRHLAKLGVEPISTTTLRLTIPPGLLLADQLLIATLQFDGKLYSGKFVFIKS